MKLRTLSTLAWLALAGLPAASAAITYAVTDLGVAEADDEFSVAYAINAAGQICGVSGASTDANPTRAFLYDVAQSPPMQSLGALPGATHSYARAINASGTVVGFSRLSGAENHAFFRVAGSTMKKVPLSDIASTAYGVNDAGVLVGKFSTLAFNFRAYLFDPSLPQAQQLTDIGALINSTFGVNAESSADAINAAGQVVGSFLGSNGYEAFLYDKSKAQQVVVFDPAPTIANSINDGGQITGTTGTQAYFYDPVQTPELRKLGTLPAGGYSEGLAINNEGWIVGNNVAAGQYRAVVWNGVTLRDLNDLIPANSGWVLKVANDITDAGVIVGSGTHDGQSRAFRLDPIFTPDSAPAHTPAAPTVKIAGKRKLVTSKASVRVRGTTTGAVTKVTLTNGRRVTKVSGTTSWRATVRLKPGRNKLTATATGPGGTSAPARITITRK